MTYKHILVGGTNNTKNWSNILLNKSTHYIDAHVMVNNQIIQTLLPNSDHIIELVNIPQYNTRSIPSLYIDHMIYYQNNKLFEFSIIINLIDDVPIESVYCFINKN